MLLYMARATSLACLQSSQVGVVACAIHTVQTQRGWHQSDKQLTTQEWPPGCRESSHGRC